MDEGTLLGYIVGPLGGFVIAILVLYGMVKRRYVAPIWALEKAEQRAELLEGENKTLNGELLELKVSNAKLTGQVEFLGMNLESVKDELKKLRKEMNSK